MADRLNKLKIEELSGVESPANELPGWLVIKTKDDGSTDVEAIAKQVDQAEANFAILYSALQAVEPYLGDADPSVAAAAQTLSQYIEDLFDGGSDDSSEGSATPTPPAAPDGSTQVQQSATKQRTGILKRLFKLDDEPEAAPEAVPATKSDETTTTKTEQGVESTAEVDAGGEKTEPGKAEEVPTEKSRDDKILEAIGGIKDHVTTTVEKQNEELQVVKDVLGNALDRLSAVESGSQGLSVEEITTSKSAGDGQTDTAAAATALRHSMLAGVARQRNGSMTLG